MLKANELDIPLELRANDITRHIINIDSRFRNNPTATSSSDFYYRLLTPVKNVLRIRITSIEFPNNYYIFTKARKNVSFSVVDGATVTDITIPDGNYSVSDLINTLTSQLNAAGLTWLTANPITFDIVSGHFTFVGTRAFAVDTAYKSFDRPFDYGLGYNMGFSQKLQVSVQTSPGVWKLVSDQCAYFAGDSYVFLKINNFDCVSHQTEDQTLTALAKIVLRDPKTYMTFDDYGSVLAKEVVFPSPQDLTRFHIQLLDAYGNNLDMCSSQYSFSMEVLEVKNSSMYNTIRDSLALRYI